MDALTKAITILIAVWLIGSWVDVLSHNDPLTGDYKYSQVNLIVAAVDALDALDGR